MVVIVWLSAERCYPMLILALAILVGLAIAQGYESDSSTGSGEQTGSTITPGSVRINTGSDTSRMGTLNRITLPQIADLDEPHLATIRETLGENDQVTPIHKAFNGNRPTPQFSPSLNTYTHKLGSQLHRTLFLEKEEKSGLCYWYNPKTSSPGGSDTYRTRESSPPDLKYDTSLLSPRLGSMYEANPLRRLSQLGPKIPKLRLHNSIYDSSRNSFRGSYGNLNPVDSARGTSTRLAPVMNLGDEDEGPSLPTEPDEEPSNHGGLSSPEDSSLSIFQKSRKAIQSTSQLKFPNHSPFVNSVTWFRPTLGGGESSELSKLEPVWQGEFIQPASAKGFVMTLLGAMTGDLWIVAKSGFPYEGYNLYSQKFIEAEAARWTKTDRRLYLSGTNLVVYTCIGTLEPFRFNLIAIQVALKLEGKPCPDVGGKFVSWGWELRKTESPFVDPRIEGDLYWQGVSSSGRLESIFPPENDSRFWWTIRRPNGDHRRVPLIGFLAAPGSQKAVLGRQDTKNLSRNLPHLARYKPIETDSSKIMTVFEEGIWFSKPFRMSSMFVQTAKSSTLVPWHIYVEERSKESTGTGSKAAIDRFLVAKQDGRDTALLKPATWIAKKTKLTRSEIMQNRIYVYPLDRYGYGSFIYSCRPEGSYLRVGTQEEATLECGKPDYVHANFEFLVTYQNFRTVKEAKNEGTEVVFAPGYQQNVKGIEAKAYGRDNGRLTSARLLAIDDASVVEGRMILLAEIFV
ncbi:hypothetical protein TWF694_001544 [Orbilia ellipsospora]|uniref:Uncharacterized protein n=1 Tax=Orbilia ellipsospora TaxID=2528407 RepID=A0AAV9XSA2_9PEZI